MSEPGRASNFSGNHQMGTGHYRTYISQEFLGYLFDLNAGNVPS